MKKSRLLFLAFALLAVGGTYALAGNTTFFTSIGDIVFPFTPPQNNGAAPGTIDNMTIGATTPQAVYATNVNASGQVTAQQVNAALGAYATNPALVSGTHYQFAANESLMMFTPSGTATYAYITLNASPPDGWQSCIFSTQTITTLYLSASAGQTLLNAATTLLANTKVCYTYSLANTTWYRSQ